MKIVPGISKKVGTIFLGHPVYDLLLAYFAHHIIKAESNSRAGGRAGGLCGKGKQPLPSLALARQRLRPLDRASASLLALARRARRAPAPRGAAALPGAAARVACDASDNKDNCIES